MKKEKEKYRLTLADKNAITGYFFILPFIIGFISFMFFPMVQSIMMAFSEVKIDLDNHRFSMTFNYLANFKRAFLEDRDFNRIFIEEMGRMFVIVIPVIIFSFFVALILNQKFRGRGIARALFFLPIILSSGIMVGLETSNSLLSGMSTLIQESNDLRSSVTGVLQNILMTDEESAVNDFMTYIFLMVDQVYTIAMSSGIQIVIFLSGLQTISPSMFEAAYIEGATKWESFWKITFPMVSSLILVNVVYSVVDYCVRTDNAVMVKIRDSLMQSMEYGFSMSMAWIYFVAVMALLGIASLIISKRVYYYDE
ncbi:MAG: sugar ABC transporter permease [Clostridiales bacterium]|jgi:ABC-type sugar transport system permease subunit|nr:sugar ABC transporter permease [Clostridiales bacterium]